MRALIHFLSLFDFSAMNDGTRKPHIVNCCLDPEAIKLFFMLNSTEHEISTAHKNLNTDK